MAFAVGCSGAGASSVEGQGRDDASVDAAVGVADAGQGQDAAQGSGDAGEFDADDSDAGDLDAGQDSAPTSCDAGAPWTGTTPSPNCAYVADSGCGPCAANGYTCTDHVWQESPSIFQALDAAVFRNVTGAEYCTAALECVRADHVHATECGSLSASTAYSCPFFADGGHPYIGGCNVETISSNGFVCCSP